MKPNRMIEELAKIEGYLSIDTFGGRVRGELENHTWRVLPKYLYSHDAMQRIVDGLDWIEGDKVAWVLGKIVGCRILNQHSRDWHLIIKATPAQKAEAVLKALGKWEEPTYAKDCPDCKGTGCTHESLYDPPVQCSCIGRFEPTETIPEQTADDREEARGEYWADSERNGD